MALNPTLLSNIHRFQINKMGMCHGYIISSPSSFPMFNIFTILISTLVNARRLLSALCAASLRVSSSVLRCAAHVGGNLRWACKFLVHQSLFQHRPQLDGDAIGNPAGAKHYSYCNSSEGGRREGEEAEECAVCLCKLEEGEEVMELRCSHMFHRECLGRWVGYRSVRATCPLCRDSLTAPPRLFNQLGDQVLIFKFSSLNSRERDAWWLR